MVCRDNHFVRYSCSAQIVIRQAAVTLGDLETRSFGEFSILLLSRDRSLAQQMGCWLRKAAGGGVSSKERSAHLSREKCVPVVKLLFNCSSKFKI